jgi:hypothetical protein
VSPTATSSKPADRNPLKAGRRGSMPGIRRIVLLVAYMGKKRLYIGPAASLIATILSALLCAGVLVAIYIVGGFLLWYLNLSPVETPMSSHDSY